MAGFMWEKNALLGSFSSFFVDVCVGHIKDVASFMCTIFIVLDLLMVFKQIKQKWL